MAILENDADRDRLLEFVQTPKDFDRLETMALADALRAGWSDERVGIGAYVSR